ncbi:DUF6633 family protein [Paraprevotella clara]|uniref:DUF6633 family protein n=1 Tax=Paraprevotella clara TaxID=454154 RepID=UPI00307B7F87
MNIRDVFNAPQLPVVEIAREIGTIKLQAIMVKWMNSFLRFYSVNGSMDAVQVADTINLILEIYPYYTQYDFKLFFKMAKMGKFGEIYGRMDGEVIINWLKKYDEHRTIAAETETMKYADRFRERYPAEKTEGVTYPEYIAIKQRAADGDKEALRQLTPP